jgi:hypothetical protein
VDKNGLSLYNRVEGKIKRKRKRKSVLLKGRLSMSEEKKKSGGYKLGVGCTGHTYQDVSLRIICHKCGQGMMYEVAKTKCEYCDHTIGMVPRVLYDQNDRLLFEVIV